MPKLYDQVRCSKFNNHVFDDFGRIKTFIEINRCPTCHPDARQEAINMRNRRYEAKRSGEVIIRGQKSKNHSSSTLSGRCKACGKWHSLPHINIHFKQHQQSPIATKPSPATLAHVPRMSITSDISFIESAKNFPVDRLVIGFENSGVYSPYQRKPQIYSGQLADAKLRQKHLHSCLDLLKNLLHSPNFIKDVLEYPEMKIEIEKIVSEVSKDHLEEGVKLLSNHIAGATKLLLLGSGCLGTVWDRIVSVICHTSPELYSATEENRRELVRLKNDTYVNGISITPRRCLVKLQISELGNSVTRIVENYGGYDHCKNMKLFTKIAKLIGRWCLDQETEGMKEAACSLMSTAGGHHIKLIYCWHNNVDYQSKKRYRSQNVRLTSVSGYQIPVPSLPRADSIMKEQKQYLVGMDNPDQIRSCVKKEDNEYFVHYLDTKIDVRSLALDVDYTYVGDIVHRRAQDGKIYRFRYMSSMVLLLIRMYKLWNLGIINNELCGDYSIELSEWHDDSKVEKAGRLDFSLQLRLKPQELFRSDLTDKQKSQVKKIMVVLYTWNFGSCPTMNLLCELAGEDRLDRGGDFCWINPSNQQQRLFFTSTRSLADNKDANLEAGKVAAGGAAYLRCKVCDSNVTDESAAMYGTQYHDITFQLLLERIQRNHLEEPKNPYGLVRTCCHFSGHFTSRERFDCSAHPLHSILNYVTEHRILGNLSRTSYDEYDRALKLYLQGDVTLFDVHCDGWSFKCKFKEQDSIFEVTLSLSDLTKWINNCSRSCDCTNTICRHLLVPLIYLHFNRKNRKLEDFELHRIKRWSDASHNIPGIYHRTLEWFRDEVPLLETEDKFDTSLEESRIKDEFGEYVTKNNMNHSDAKLCALKSQTIHFGKDDNLITNYEPHGVHSTVLLEACDASFSREDDDHELQLVPPVIPTQSGSHSNQPNRSATASHEDNEDSHEPFLFPSDNDATEDIDSPKSTITIETENARWILVCVSLLTAMSVLPYRMWIKKKQQYAFTYHWASFFFTKLSFHRWGKTFTNSNYIHDNFRHMADLFEIEPFVDCSTDEFEEFFAEIKYSFRTSCHKKGLAEIAIAMRQQAKEYLFMIHPALKRGKSITQISKFLESDSFSLKNVLIPDEVLNHVDFKECISKKREELNGRGYGKYMCRCKDGLLLLFTGQIIAPIYLPRVSMLCDKKKRENKASLVFCECQERKAVQSCAFHKCCNCCTAANAEGLDSEGEIGICKSHKKTIANRIKKSEETCEDEKNKTDGNVKRKTPKGKKSTPPPKRQRSIVSSSLSSSQQQSSSLFTSSQMSLFQQQNNILALFESQKVRRDHLHHHFSNQQNQLQQTQYARMQNLRPQNSVFLPHQLQLFHQQEKLLLRYKQLNVRIIELQEQNTQSSAISDRAQQILKNLSQTY